MNVNPVFVSDRAFSGARLRKRKAFDWLDRGDFYATILLSSDFHIEIKCFIHCPQALFVSCLLISPLKVSDV